MTKRKTPPRECDPEQATQHLVWLARSLKWELDNGRPATRGRLEFTIEALALYLGGAVGSLDDAFGVKTGKGRPQKKLTPLDRKIWQLRWQGLSWGKIMGILVADGDVSEYADERAVRRSFKKQELILDIEALTNLDTK